MGPSSDSSVPSGQFQFITMQSPEDAKDRTQRRLARSHAVKHALETKRRQQQRCRTNFRVTTLKETGSPRKVVSISRPLPLFSSPSASALDPFQTLAVDSSRLQILLGDYRARQAPEPVFSIVEELAFQNFYSVFRTGFDDPALLNAVMLSFAFAVTGGSLDRECLRYQGQAISYIRERMGVGSLREAISEATIGAILLLAGVEARLGMTPQVQFHMGAVQQLLGICQERGVYLTGGIKRAIFWQDLNSSILADTPRKYTHATFSELHWTRDPFVPSFFHLPPGFQSRYDLLIPELIEVLEDLHALQCIRELPVPHNPNYNSNYTTKDSDAMLMARINNHTASIQSRLVSLPRFSDLQECCRLAAYICSVMLCCQIWGGLVIPHQISTTLLITLQRTLSDPKNIWTQHPDLLIWLLYIGGAFAPRGPIRDGYINLLRSCSNNGARLGALYRSWSELLAILRRFIWSDRGILGPVRGVWEEVGARS
ncbi:hypothetical protein BJX99DRAFT_268676 [Aspergillus californicus]